jgi:hypothetical protein
MQVRRSEGFLDLCEATFGELAHTRRYHSIIHFYLNPAHTVELVEHPEAMRQLFPRKE